MPRVLLCPHGHRWEVSSDAAPVSDALPMHCPTCGVSIQAAANPTEAETVLPVAAVGVAETATVVRAEMNGPAPAIAGYEMLGELGRGGMGIVYKARQPNLDRRVAIKVLPTEASKESTFAERFTREARALARLNHPNILTIYDFGQADGQSYFVMEYVDGANLRQRLRQGALPPSEVLRIIGQVCEALQYAHEEGIVHRDIKPENVLLDHKGRVKIADFGIAKLVTRKTGEYTLTGPWQVMGTWHYMAPEQLENPQELDHRADIYAVGVMLYELLTGGLPQGHFPLPSQKVGTDPRLDAVVLKALEKEPARRYQHVRELKAALDTLQQPSGVALPVMAVPVARVAETTFVWPTTGLPFGSAAAWTRRVRRPALWLIFAGLLTLAPTIGYWFLRSVSAIGRGDSGLATYFNYVPPVPALLMIGAGLALYYRRGRWLVVLGSLAAFAAGTFTWPANVVAAFFGLATVLRRDIRAAFRLGPWPADSPDIVPLLPVWTRSSQFWCLACCVAGLFFCVQPWGPWVEVWPTFPRPDVEAAFTGPRLAAAYGYQSSFGLGAAGLFLALFLVLLATGRLGAPALWQAIAVMVTGTLVLLILLLGLKDSFGAPNMLPFTIAKQLGVGRVKFIFGGAFHWALAMAFALLLLGTLQLRRILAVRTPPVA